MTRIRDWFITIYTKRGNHLCQSDTVPFDSFTNECPEPKSSKIKESSLIRKSVQPNNVKTDNYDRFSANSEINSSSCPSYVTILLIILLTSVFLVLPVIYLLHCFNLFYANFEPDSYRHVKDEAHYSPSSTVHKLLSSSEVVKDIHFSSHVIDIGANFKKTSLPLKNNNDLCKNIKDDDKFDCYPESGVSKSTCEARGCCWMSTDKKESHDKIDVPYCFYPSNYGGYKYLNVTKTAYGLDAYLKRTFKSPYADDVDIVKMIVKFENENRLHVKIIDPQKKRFEPPYPEIPLVDRATLNTTYSFIIDSTKTGFKILRKIDGTVIFNSINVGAFIFANQFIQMSTLLPSKYIYGLGEHRSNLLLSVQWQKFTMFNLDQPPVENLNLYGSHPMYLGLEPSGKAYGVFLLNSNALDVILQPAPAVTFRTIGGVLDFYFVMGPTPTKVIQQYTDIIGRPFMPPKWGLGFHLCKFGYNTLNRTKEIWKRTLDAGIPLDVQWNDIDYMNSSNDFTYDHVRFKELPEFVEELHSMGMHYVNIIDPGVSGSETPGSYPAYDKGIAMNIFVKNDSGFPFIGKVWNTKSTVWPDFTHPNTVDYWTSMLRSQHEMFQFDGAWIDMNEPSNFLSGSTTGCPKSLLENPPYLPGIHGGQLNYKTMCMTSQHYAGLHYDVHNLYGFSEAIITNFALAEIRGKRPFIISRSSFPGLGHYAGHWTGDVFSTWDEMKFSIPQLLNFNMFGIPLVGADICGFNGNTTAKLCQRWMELGAFYTFSRNHNTDDGIDQDPVALGPEVVSASQKALNVRYSLLPYLYTLFWKAHIDGDTVARPLFFEFINDIKTYDIDDQFLWGSSIMITPVLEEDKTVLWPYLPAGLWYDFYNYNIISSKGERVQITAPLDTIPLFIRGGSVLPMQTPRSNTHLMRNENIQILATPDWNGQGFGYLYWDDDDSLNSIEELRYSLLNFTLKPGELHTCVMWSGTEKPPNLGKITILGVTTSVSSVTVNEENLPFSYNTINKYLTINLSVTLMRSNIVKWK